MRTRTLSHALFNSKSKELKDTCLKCKCLTIIINYNQFFYCWINLSGIWCRIQEMKYRSRCNLQSRSPCKNFVSSSLCCAAFPRQFLWIRGTPEGSWALLSWAESQVHLYVSAVDIFLFSSPVTCNREEESFSFSLLKIPSLSPATAPKIDWL